MSNKNRISMKQVNRQNQYAEFSMTISTSRELWRYLFRGQKNSSEKLTRVEAFHDLIERQYAALRQEPGTGIEIPRVPLLRIWKCLGQLVVTT